MNYINLIIYAYVMLLYTVMLGDNIIYHIMFGRNNYAFNSGQLCILKYCIIYIYIERERDIHISLNSSSCS